MTAIMIIRGVLMKKEMLEWIVGLGFVLPLFLVAMMGAAYRLYLIFSV